jgi:hypothetical protein
MNISTNKAIMDTDSIVYPFFEIYCCKDLVGRQKIGKSDYTASGKESDSNFKNDEFTM